MDLFDLQYGCPLALKELKKETAILVGPVTTDCVTFQISIKTAAKEQVAAWWRSQSAGN